MNAVRVRELKVTGGWEFAPTTFHDRRGLFVAPFQSDAFIKATGRPMILGQTNHSVSQRGVIRGIHFADVPPGQGKYVYCPRGALLDVVVDIRVGSPTFGQCDVVRLDANEYRGLFIAEGLGHAMMALENDTVLCYLCTTGYNPGAEHGISPLDPQLKLPWPADIPPILSEKDAAAPTLAEATASGLLPDYEECLAFYRKSADTSA